MTHWTKPPRARSALIVLALLSAVLTVVGTGTAAAQTAPTVTNPGNQSADVGYRMCLPLEASGPGTITFAAAGSFPPGVTVTTFGLVEGIPSTAGTTTIRVNATSSAGGTTQIAFNLTRFNPRPGDPVIKAGRYDSGFNIDCFSAGSPANTFLSDVGNFGPGGTVNLPRGLVIAHQTALDNDGTQFITEEYLSDADILFDGFVQEDRYTRLELRLIEQWVIDGGVLIAAEDDPQSDRLGRLFGAPTVGAAPHCGLSGEPACNRFAPAPSASNHRIVSGPFGRWNSILTAGTVGWFGRSPGAEWTIVAQNNRDLPTVLERKVGNGHVILLSDEGLVRSALDGQNGRFVGNLFAFALAQVTKVPSPGNDVLSGRLFQNFGADICRNDGKGDGRQRVAITGGSLPPDLRLRGCRLTGTPRLGSFGTYGFTYSVTDRDGDVATADVQVTINGVRPADSNPRCKGRQATIVGTNGDDVFNGTNGPDVIVAGNGSDVVNGLGGNDLICGGRGSDTINSGDGTDSIFGDSGGDVLEGGSGSGDLCNGGSGPDTIGSSCERRARR